MNSCNHCWHGNNEYFATMPPKYMLVCCHCDASIEYRKMLDSEQGHGPYLLFQNPLTKSKTTPPGMKEPLTESPPKPPKRIEYTGPYQPPAEKYEDLQYHQIRWNHETTAPEYIDTRTGKVVPNPMLDPEWRFKYQLQGLHPTQQALYVWNPDRGDPEQGYGWWEIPASVEDTHRLLPDGRWVPR